MSCCRPVAIAAAVVACGGQERAPSVPEHAIATVVSGDSLAVAAVGGTEIWFTLARRGQRSDGTACVDRAIEIRHGGQRTPVPLLYTGEAPRIVNDTTARAILYTDCRPGDAYLVDLRSGRPTREHR